MGARLALLVSGASGMQLPRQLLRRLVDEPAIEAVHLVVSAGATKVLRYELAEDATVDGRRLGGAELLLHAAGIAADSPGAVRVWNDKELDAPVASGSYRLDGTVVLPCSSGTLGALATGAADTLVRRAGAVALKEGWPLLLGFRETPLSVVHLENLRRLAYLGARIVPPIPAFYLGGESLERFVDAYCQRLIDVLAIGVVGDPDLRWREEQP